MHFAESFLFFEANEPPAAQACQAPRVAGGRKSILQKWIMTCQGIVCFIDKEHNKFTFFFSCSDFFFLRTKFIISNFTEDVGALRETFQVFVGFGNGTCFFFGFPLAHLRGKDLSHEGWLWKHSSGKLSGRQEVFTNLWSREIGHSKL